MISAADNTDTGVTENLLLTDDNFSSFKPSNNFVLSSGSENSSIGQQNGDEFCLKRMPKNQILFFAQIFLIYCIIAVSLSQLILESTEKELWLVLLSTSVGYILPSPRLKYLKLATVPSTDPIPAKGVSLIRPSTPASVVV